MSTNKDMKKKAEFLKVFSHHTRLMILKELLQGVKCVNDIEELLEISQSNISQHLAQLRHQCIVDFYEDGTLRCYYLTKPRLVQDIFTFLEKDYPVLERTKEDVKREGGVRKLMNGTISKSLSEMTQDEIKEAVKIRYSEVAKTPNTKFNFPVGRVFAEGVGYPKDVLDRLPPPLYESFTGAGNPQQYVDAQKGETLLDIGCGAGLDIYFYAEKIGSIGKLYGLDISPEMIDKAARNLTSLEIKNFEPLCCHSDDIKLSDSSVDIVTSNGIYNLSPDKESVLKEVFRVLRPGGRTVFSEIVLKASLDEEIRKNINDWFRCIGGALTESGFITLMSKVGFEKIEILSKSRNARTGHKLAICANIRAYKPLNHC